ncbi:MAG TPA: hypothetical protein DDW94_05320 [Deltaproteobacteria bacterium]|nr:MAG: hypothetical protein A2Z79_04635 [Deltaproteobacteria bacterium GWA2_55_82]OGQ64206.1 MAG: hypothetical protein A3I81_11025 [Deltaproteobacteria bacterium RIFCSPLOWO2_02_FULL_55_12]OIJ74662.1 MAG: hypothetical protein A2V21_310545 [Deltaproteobacteria bacterium GWC2_55_46]HBG46394.1 hypothetical protein [Deltaproteobacteria bacterium]HCY10605.1 hypothetical protein [Deltaproteobacteria bacterium]
MEYTPEITGELKRKGCSKVMSLGDLRLYECPSSYFDEETLKIVSLVFLLEGTGRLYHAGQWADQPCWLVEAVQIFNSERARLAGERDG